MAFSYMYLHDWMQNASFNIWPKPSLTLLSAHHSENAFHMETKENKAKTKKKNDWIMMQLLVFNIIPTPFEKKIAKSC